jgi:hypothetical protein
MTSLRRSRLRLNMAARVDGVQHVRHLTEHGIMDGGEEAAPTRPGGAVAVDIVRGRLIERMTTTTSIH